MKTLEIHSKEPGFSRREWLMLISLLMLLEAVILNSGYQFKQQLDVINYVSFAATIASLLLAVLAIIYGFLQADGQQKSMAAFMTQIEAMRSLQAELSSSSQGISEQLSGMEASTEQLKRLSDAMESTHKTVGVIEGGLHNLREEQRALQQSIVQGLEAKSKKVATEIDLPVQQDSEVPELVEAVFRRATYEADVLGVALNELVNKRNGHSDSWSDFVQTHYAKPISSLEGGHLDSFQAYLVGSHTLQTARALGLVTFVRGSDGSRSQLEVPQNVRAALASAAEKTKASKATKEMARVIEASFI